MPHFFDSLNFGAVDLLALPLAVLLLTALALAFDFLNGVHDSANSIATVVSTRVLSPLQAVLWAAFFNFIAFLVFHLSVAGTIGRNIVGPDVISDQVIFATLLSACAWNILTWYLGLPTSSSHALTFSLVGAGLATAGPAALQWNGLGMTVVFIVLSPLIGGAVGICVAIAVMWIFRRAKPLLVEKFFRRGQLVSAAFYSLGHGGNDAQKTMGIILALLLAYYNAHPSLRWEGRYTLNEASLQKLQHEPDALPPSVLARLQDLQDQSFATPIAFEEALAGVLPSGTIERYRGRLLTAADVAQVPTEIVLACHLAMGLGTLLGGWRIVKTMGQRITRLRPVDGFCAETGAAVTLAMTVFGGIPVSTTHTITGALVGVGSLKRLSAVRWIVATRIVWAWVLTIPGTIIMAGAILLVLRLFV